MKNEYAVMKAGASVLVVAGHVIIFYSAAGGVVDMPTNALLDYLMKFIYSFHMPLFMFVSGAVYRKGIASGKYKNFWENKLYRLLEKDCFGIYLAHPMIIYICFYYFRNMMYNPYITSILVTLIAIVISVLFIELLHRIKQGIVLLRHGNILN